MQPLHQKRSQDLSPKDVSLLDTLKTESIGTYHMKEGISDVNTTKMSALTLSKRFGQIDIVLFLLPLLIFIGWFIALTPVSLNAMNDLGLVSALPPGVIIAFALLVVSFTFALQRRELRIPILALHLLCLIFVLYGTPNLVEQMPRFAVVYKHAGLTDFIMNADTLKPRLDLYFNFPGFFALNAFLTKTFGYSTTLSYAGWAPVFFNVIYFGPMYMIFTSMTTNQRLVWLSLLFFYLTNWVGQDYFSPQGFAFFLYLVMIGILLKWFTNPPQYNRGQAHVGNSSPFLSNIQAWFQAPDPQSPAIGAWQRLGLVCCLILIFGLIVISHPLTPFFALVSVSLLVLFRRCYPSWLPFLMALMIGVCFVTIAKTFVFQHANQIFGSFGNLFGNIPSSVTTGQLQEDALGQVVARMRLYSTALLWLLAFLGALQRVRQGHRDITYILLTMAPFPLVAAQAYGGEILMRIYLFSEPFMVFFAAALFCDSALARKSVSVRVRKPATSTAKWRTALIVTANLLLLGTFLFTRYGDEHMDYVTYDEWNAMQYLYQIAPPQSLIVEAWYDSPLEFKYVDRYHLSSFTEALPEVTKTHAFNADDIVQYFSSDRYLFTGYAADYYGPYNKAYIFFSQEEQIQATAHYGLASDALRRLEVDLLKTKVFRVIYSNADAQILEFIGTPSS